MKLLARIFLRLNGWQIEGSPPELDRYVLVAAPHTSNWDLVYMLAFRWAFGLRIRWLGKHTLFRGWFGVLLRRLGGVPVRRGAPGGAVAHAIQWFEMAPKLALVLTPEGTRDFRAIWKSGFYHIASGAGVPIVLTFLDYRRRCGGFGPTIVATGDVTADMDRVRAFYRGVSGKFPENFAEPRLFEETPHQVAALDSGPASAGRTGKVAPAGSPAAAERS